MEKVSDFTYKVMDCELTFDFQEQDLGVMTEGSKTSLISALINQNNISDSKKF